ELTEDQFFGHVLDTPLPFGVSPFTGQVEGDFEQPVVVIGKILSVLVDGGHERAANTYCGGESVGADLGVEVNGVQVLEDLDGAVGGPFLPQFGQHVAAGRLVVLLEAAHVLEETVDQPLRCDPELRPSGQKAHVTAVGVGGDVTTVTRYDRACGGDHRATGHQQAEHRPGRERPDHTTEAAGGDHPISSSPSSPVRTERSVSFCSEAEPSVSDSSSSV